MYEEPQIQDLGTVEELTGALNKVGHTPDMYSKATPIVGSVVSIP